MSSTESGPGGSSARRPTINDVARHAGISKGTVSLALRGAPGPSAETTARVLRAAEELGYRASRSASLLARRRTNLLGLTLTLRNAFHAELAEGVQAAADEAGYELVLSPVTAARAEARAVETLLDSRCEAVLLLGPELPAADLDDLAARVPVVVVGRAVEGVGLDVVRTSDEAGIALAVEHLVGLGHRALAHVAAGRGPIGTARTESFRAAVRRAGVAEASLVVEAGEFSETAGARAGATLLDGPVTGIVAASDRIALGVLDALGRGGRAVPDEMSVVGYDDSPWARLGHVQLTSVSQEPAEQARAAVRAAVDRLDGGPRPPRETVLRPRLVTRATSAPPPSGGR
ncbi:LacI family DNA-binding transcriptional regulator [Kineococcus gynurae]|uniref:LacI family DNA-binding transcriptional regulator n=1 Tax=Kineococcus gynurae TaxID=452979 RepID=A0ABV5LRU8_9ACTN